MNGEFNRNNDYSSNDQMNNINNFNSQGNNNHMGNITTNNSGSKIISKRYKIIITTALILSLVMIISNGISNWFSDLYVVDMVRNGGEFRTTYNVIIELLDTFAYIIPIVITILSIVFLIIDKKDNKNNNIDKMYIDKLNNKLSEEMYERLLEKLKKAEKDKEIEYIDLKKEAEECTDDNDSEIERLVKEFLKLEKPTPEIMRVLINRIEIHQDKQVDLLFNFKKLNNIELFEKFE